MFRKSVFGIALSLGLTASTTLAAGPLFEFRFNSLEDSAFTSSGTSAIEVYIKNSATKSDGLTGKRWDGALDNTGIERMGGRPVAVPSPVTGPNCIRPSPSR